MYTDETVLGYGKYKNKQLKNIPKEYFINVYKSAGDEHLELKQYIEANRYKFPELDAFFIKNKSAPIVTFICNKRTFPSKKDAMDSIVKPKTKSTRKIPIRAYECENCSGWHLTSKEHERFREIS